jgi:hypothetical protein
VQTATAATSGIDCAHEQSGLHQSTMKAALFGV